MQHIRYNRQLLENNDSAPHFSKYMIAPMWEIDIVHKRVPTVGVHGLPLREVRKLKT
jgi:hypothetical protein